MKNYSVDPIEELSTSEFRPVWMHSDSTADCWYVPRTGTSVDNSAPATSPKYAKVDFGFMFCDGSKGTDPQWHLLVRDIKSSGIALIENTISKRPNSLTGFVRTAFEVIDHVLEQRAKSNLAGKILTLSDITATHIKGYLYAHDLIGLGINITNLDAILGSSARNRENILSALSTTDIPTITKKY